MQEEQGVWIFDIQLGAFEGKHTHIYRHRRSEAGRPLYYIASIVLAAFCSPFSEPCSFGSWLAGCVCILLKLASGAWSYGGNTSSLYPYGG